MPKESQTCNMDQFIYIGINKALIK